MVLPALLTERMHSVPEKRGGSDAGGFHFFIISEQDTGRKSISNSGFLYEKRYKGSARIQFFNKTVRTVKAAGRGNQKQ
jgi:hypothetical protein